MKPFKKIAEEIAEKNKCRTTGKYGFTGGFLSDCEKSAGEFCEAIGALPIFGQYHKGWVVQGTGAVFVELEPGYLEPQTKEAVR